jgi:hypothetical protein
MKLVRVMFMSCALIVGSAPLAAAQPGPSSAQTQQRMMGGGQMPMTGGAMMPMMGMADHIEGHLAFLKTELKITDAQEPQWNAFADVMRASAAQMAGMMKQGAPMMQGDATLSLPQRVDLQETHMAAHLDMLRKMKGALLPLYASFTDDQKRSADELFRGPMGM